MSNKSNNTLVSEGNNTLVCDQCGAENWNLASEGKRHDQPADEVKGYDACDGIWRLPAPRAAARRPGVVIPFPASESRQPE